ncbi:MAG: S9 family peptidase [Bacteroidales bacterium]|nr:S9 family peptidase [Bacteroidales bacterium]
MMKRLNIFWRMLLIGAAFSCSPKSEGTVEFLGRQVPVQSFLEGFPYSTWGFYLSDDATRLTYVRNTDGNPLLQLDLTECTDISKGKVLSADDWSVKNFWHPQWNEKDGCLYWMGDQANDEKIDLYRLNPATGETTCFTDVPYIYGWSFNDDKTLAGYVARISQTENDHVDEFHVLNVVTGEDKLICTDKADFRMTWTEVSFSPDNSGAMLTVLKNVNRTHTNMAYLDFASGEYKVVTNPALEASLSGCAVISPWFSEEVAYFLSDQTGFANLYSYNRATGVTAQVTDYKTDINAKWIEADGVKLLAAVSTSPEGSVVRVITPEGEEVASAMYPATLTLQTTVENKAYFTAGATDILFQIWEVTYADGALSRKVVVDLPSKTRKSMIASHAKKLSIPTFDIDPATGETRQLHAYLMVPENPLPAHQARLMVMSFYGGDNAYDVEHQIFTAAGMYVLSASPRGSSGFGRDFAALNDHDLGGNETIDMIYCARYVSEMLGIPPERVGCFGMSHGGYETMRLMTFPGEVNGFKASFPFGFGVAVAGFCDIIWEHYHSNIPDWDYLEAGDPVTEKDKLMDRSPISHVDKISGPLLLIHGDHDDRVDIGGSSMLYDALKAQGSPVEFVIMEGQGHGYKGLDNQMKYYRSILDFIQNYTGQE